MHPFLSHPRWLLTWVAAWLGLGVIPAALLALPGDPSFWPSLALALPATVALAVITLPTWYVCRATPLAPAALARLAVTHALLAAFWSGLYLGLFDGGARLVAAVPGWESLPTLVAGRRPLLFGVGVLFYLLVVGFHYLLLGLEAASAAELRQGQLETAAREAEIRALKAQIHPHFLFNSLNAVSALTTTNPAQAREMCVRLADFLRKSLGASARPLVTLAEELELTHAYLGVEQIRLGERLRIDEQIDQDSGDSLVPPLLLQPLVENAITHGIANLEAGGTLTLTARREHDRLHLEVSNPFDPEAKGRRGSGLGLANVRGRLAGRYGKEALFDAGPRGDRFRVTLSLPLARE